VYKDRVQLGETSFGAQAVQSAVEVSYAIANDQFSSGIIGMAMNSINSVRPTKQKTYIENIKDELEVPLFTVNLRKGRPGNYNFGYINELEYTGEIEYAPIKKGSHYWEVIVSGYQVGEDGEWQDYAWTGIVDTGTTLLLLPDHIIRDYYAKVPGASFDPYVGMMTFPCDTELPDFVFGVGTGYKGSVPGNYINYTEARPGVCYGGIQSSEGIGMAIIGDVLIKAQFIVFDMGSYTVGFANKELDGMARTAPKPKPQTPGTRPAPPPKSVPQPGPQPEAASDGIGNV
jgi:hypothetical protein